jgi:anti-sigma-K factor RskA
VADHHNQFDDLERELRESLAVRPAPEGFAEKVLARVTNPEATQDPRLKGALLYKKVFTSVTNQETRRQSRPALFPHWRGALAAVLIAAVLIAATFWQHRREQRIAGERARSQVILALRITNSTLDTILLQKIQHPAKEAQP